MARCPCCSLGWVCSASRSVCQMVEPLMSFASVAAQATRMWTTGPVLLVL